MSDRDESPDAADLKEKAPSWGIQPQAFRYNNPEHTRWFKSLPAVGLKMFQSATHFSGELMYTLIVNHMQNVFPYTVEPIIPQVVREIRCAIASGGAIVVLEIADGYPSTDVQIMSVLEKEAPGRFDVKYGWPEKSAQLVKEAIEANGWPANRVRVTGVNIPSCMFTLVVGLSGLDFERIEVIQDACNCRASHDDDPWELYSDLPRVVLLQTG